MAIDGVVIHRIINTLNEKVPLKINRITQPSDHEFIFHCFERQKRLLLVSIHPVFSRLHYTQHRPTANIAPSHFLNVLRKHLENGIIQSITQYNFDRVITISIDHRDDMGVIHHFQLVIELLGKYANIILIDDNATIIDAFKRIAHFENKQRVIVAGSAYTFPDQFAKKSFLALGEYDLNQGLMQQFNGISPLLEKEITYRLHDQSVSDILKEIMASSSLYIHDHQFHIIPLLHLKTPYQEFPIAEGLDYFYHSLQQQDHIKAQTGDLLKAVKRELKRSNTKLPKLQEELRMATDSEHLRYAGDLLFSFYHQASKGKTSVTLSDFEGKETVIELDPKLSGKDNARKYFTRYQKAKTSLRYLNEQIAATQDKIDYLESIVFQLEQATLEDAQEIAQELSSLRIKRKETPSKKQSKKKPNYLSIQPDANTRILIGKNNLQNEYLTFKHARKDDIWFHAAHTGGAHVILQAEDINEATIRLCAQFAAWHSKSRLGSSVEIHYTAIRNIKKIPGAQPGKVSIKNHKSIFIDPDPILMTKYQ